MSLEMPTWFSRYRPTVPITWQGRRDGPDATRYHEVVKVIDLRANVPVLNPHDIVLLGFACDEGIRRNQGRVGAGAGPASLRQALGKLPFLVAGNPAFYDLGDIACEDGNLEGAQQALADIVSDLVRQGVRPIVLGGGHEVVWGHYQGLIQTRCSHNLGALNFDAHYDLRPLMDGSLGNSGTSFTQIALEREKAKMPFDYLCIGVQHLGNTQALSETVQKLGVKSVGADVIHLEGISKAIEAIDQQLQRCDCMYVTLCMDVFAAAFAPGVSAPQPLGLTPWEVQPLLQHIASSKKMLTFNVAELSPGYDPDNRTAALAAAMVATVIESMSKGQ
ncbi:MAG: formimidoylglutamase [Chlamydiales bacterium]|nr:formimidoylglutamase [Chlamydiales bacterium]